MRDPATYAGQGVCSRCGSGWPCCGDVRPDGTHYGHEETCARYRWSYPDVCGRCSLQLSLDLRGLA